MTSLVFAFLFFVQLFSCFFHPLLTFSLKNCTIGSLDKTVEVMCQKRGLKEIPDDIPPHSNILDLSFNNLSEIKATNLKRLSKLISLSLNDNHINWIEDGSFADLIELKMLQISYNKVTNLTDNMFVGLTNLVSLLLNTNHISQISPKAFEPLVSLRRVILDANYIGCIRDFAKLFQLPHIELISFNNNNITFFDSDNLPFNTTNVNSLFFGHNYIKKFSLKRDIFPHLQSFQISNRKKFDWDVPNKTFLSSVTTMSFGKPNKVNLDTFVAMLHSTSSLKVLALEFSDPISIKSLVQVACSIPSMTKLMVSLSTLGTIDDDLLRPCSNVTELMLPLNSLNKLSDQSLKSLSKLRLLDLDTNKLHQVPSTIRHLSALESLDLSNNYIGDISCFDFANLTKLTTLNLRRNHIANMDECVFQNLYNLKRLDVGKNTVHSFRNAFRVNLSKLERLDFDHNGHHFILQQGEFGNLSSLHFLNLESSQYVISQDGVFEGLNRLQNLICPTGQFTKGFFEGLLELKYLLLYIYRPITKLTISQLDSSPFSGLINLQQLSLIVYPKATMDITPDFFNGLKSLEYLKVDNFFQTSIHPDTFRYTPQLLSLEIINSTLSVLAPEVFYPIPKLLKLNLSNNKFSTLNFLANLKALRFLKATDNLLNVINGTIFQTLPNLTSLDLRNNPLICDCLNADFQQWVLSNNQTQVINGHQYKCVTPDTQQTHNFLTLDTRSCWIDFGFICFISSCCLIALTLFASFVYSFLRWQLAYAYYLFLAYVYDIKSKKKGTGHLYDAFISYNVHDEDWVYSEMLPVLEGRQGWRLCLHHRDFEPGKPIVENITDAIYGSRKTICVISQHYLQSEWCSREIQMASVRLFDEKKDVLILVFLEDIPTWRLSPYYQIRRLVKKHTYLSWSQAAQHKRVFWQKLNQALKTGNAPNDNKHFIVEPEDNVL